MSLEDRRRRGERLPIVINGTCRIDGRQSHPCRTADLSYYDARLETADIAKIGERAVLLIPNIGALACRVVRATKDGFVVEFDMKRSSEEMLELDVFLLQHVLSPGLQPAY